MTTLREAIETLRFLAFPLKPKKGIAAQLLGQYKGVIPKGRTSTQWIRAQRKNLYGKIK